MNSSSLKIKKQLRLSYKIRSSSIQAMMEEVLSCIGLSNFNIFAIEWSLGVVSLTAESKKMSIRISTEFHDFYSLGVKSLGNSIIRIGPTGDEVNRLMEEKKTIPWYKFHVVDFSLDIGELSDFCLNYELPTELEKIQSTSRACGEIAVRD